jgi:hypothetical protein
MLIDLFWPARHAMSQVSDWPLIGIAGFVVSMLLFGVAPLS